METNTVNADLKRFTDNIGDSIINFFKITGEGKEFRADDLRDYVIGHVEGHVAPSSPTRIQQDMRKRGVINYELVSRSKSLYRVISFPVTAEQAV